MAKSKAEKFEKPVEQAPAFSLVQDRNEFIDGQFDKAEAEDAEKAAEVEEAIPEIKDETEVEVEPEAELEPVVEETDGKPDYDRLKTDYENLKGQNTEEREKRKAKNTELEEVKGQLNEVLQDYRKLVESKDAKPDTEEWDDEGADKNTLALMTELKSLKGEVLSLKSERQNEKATSAQDLYQKSLVNTDKSLEESGYPGFFMMRAAVQDTLAGMVRDDPDNAIYDNPEGWVKIYKERVWPDVKKNFSVVSKAATDKEKIEAKKKAGLVTDTGKNPAKPKDDDEKWDFNDYLKMRRTKQLG